jgi:hypothetical protein
MRNIQHCLMLVFWNGICQNLHIHPLSENTEFELLSRILECPLFVWVHELLPPPHISLRTDSHTRLLPAALLLCPPARACPSCHPSLVPRPSFENIPLVMLLMNMYRKLVVSLISHRKNIQGGSDISVILQIFL